MLYVVHTESSNAPYGADFAALIAPVSISLFDAALRECQCRLGKAECSRTNDDDDDDDDHDNVPYIYKTMQSLPLALALPGSISCPQASWHHSSS